MKQNHSLAWSFVSVCLLLYACCFVSCAYVDRQPRPQPYPRYDAPRYHDDYYRRPTYQPLPRRPVEREA